MRWNEEDEGGRRFVVDGVVAVVGVNPVVGDVVAGMCVFITAGPSAKLFACGGEGYWRTCATRDDEPRPVWTSLPVTH